MTAFFSWIAGGRLVAGLTMALGLYSIVGACGVYTLARTLNAGRYAWLAVCLWLIMPFRAFEMGGFNRSSQHLRFELSSKVRLASRLESSRLNLFSILVNSDMTRKVREPIQVYLTRAERADLDRAARDLGVSRSEALRRGIEAVSTTRGSGPLRGLIEEGFVTPRASGPGPPPSAAPVAPLSEILCELAADREDRGE